MPLLRKALLLAIVLFLAYTAANKCIYFDDFTLNIAKTSVFPEPWIKVVAYGACASEIGCILLLVCKEKVGIGATLLMMAAFTAYISLLAAFGRYEVCGCGGILNGLSFGYHFAINATLILALVYALLYENK